MKTLLLFILTVTPFSLAYPQKFWVPPLLEAKLGKAEAERAKKVLGAFEAEREPILKACRQQVREITPSLLNGDFSGIDAAAERRDLELLWHLVCDAHSAITGGMFAKYGNSPKRSEEHEKLSAAIVNQVRQKLAVIPGHTKPQVELLERMASTPGFGNSRLQPLSLMGIVGSMECIQQIGRYLNDPRNPDSGMYDPLEGLSEPRGLHSGAADAMHEALGAASPGGPNPVLELAGRMKFLDWWNTESARPYREWNYEDYEPMPPPRKRAVSLRPPAAVIQATVPEDRQSLWPVVMILVLAALAALLGFTKLRQRS